MPVSGSVVFLPAHNLSVRLGRFDLNMNGVQLVDVYYDPTLDPTRLLMPDKESPYYIESDEQPSSPRMIPFISRSQVSLGSLGFVPHDEEAVLVYSNRSDGDSARLYARTFANKLELAGLNAGFVLLHQVLAAIGKLEHWLVEDLGFAGAWKRVEIRLLRSFVDAIHEATGMSFPVVGSNECLISAFEIRH